MSSDEGSTFWEEFIEIYQENPCLWNTTREDYNNQSKRNIAYGLLVEKLWEIDEEADTDTVIKKVLSFRTWLSREVEKMKRSKELGQIYAPTWRYYKPLSFLIPFLENEEAPKIYSDEAQPTTTVITSSTESTQDKFIDVASLSTKDNERSKISLQGKKRKLSNNAEDVDWEDDCSTFTANVRTRMRALDHMQKCIAQKLISDVMFLAETKQLQLSSNISMS